MLKVQKGYIWHRKRLIDTHFKPLIGFIWTYKYTIVAWKEIEPSKVWCVPHLSGHLKGEEWKMGESWLWIIKDIMKLVIKISLSKLKITFRRPDCVFEMGYTQRNRRQDIDIRSWKSLLYVKQIDSMTKRCNGRATSACEIVVW
jgi:hypothetical protein